MHGGLMAETSESFVRVAADSVGKRMRTLQAEILQPDGTMQVVQIQVAALTDESGAILDLDDSAWKSRVVQLLEQQLDLLQELTSFSGKQSLGTSKFSRKNG